MEINVPKEVFEDLMRTHVLSKKTCKDQDGNTIPNSFSGCDIVGNTILKPK